MDPAGIALNRHGWSPLQCRTRKASAALTIEFKCRRMSVSPAIEDSTLLAVKGGTRFGHLAASPSSLLSQGVAESTKQVARAVSILPLFDSMVFADGTLFDPL